jgi:hypothetical protein
LYQSNTTVLLIPKKYNYLGLHGSTLSESFSGPLRYRSNISCVYNGLRDPQHLQI